MTKNNSTHVLRGATDSITLREMASQSGVSITTAWRYMKKNNLYTERQLYLRIRSQESQHYRNVTLPIWDYDDDRYTLWVDLSDITAHRITKHTRACGWKLLTMYYCDESHQWYKYVRIYNGYPTQTSITSQVTTMIKKYDIRAVIGDCEFHYLDKSYGGFCDYYKASQWNCQSQVNEKYHGAMKNSVYAHLITVMADNHITKQQLKTSHSHLLVDAYMTILKKHNYILIEASQSQSQPIPITI